MTETQAAFWQSFLASQSQGLTLTVAPSFLGPCGNNKELGDALAELVCGGTKTTTSALMWEIEADGETPTPVGGLEIVTNWAGDPLCVIEITESTVRPFNEIDAAFAYDYGEGDRTLAWWREHLGDYYADICAKIGREPSETMPLNCVRFRLLPQGESHDVVDR